jgi:uncharacterized protein (TIGR02145 family)
MRSENAIISGTTNTSGIVARMVLAVCLLLTVLSCDSNNPANSTTPVPVTGVTIIKNSTLVLIGATEQLVAAIQPSNSTNKSVTWTSANSSVAAVSASGLVTGLSVGITTVTVRTTDGNFTAQCNVTVANNQTETATDIDGNTYKTVKIGTQVWTTENLRTTRYNDGMPVPYVADGTIWLEKTSPAYCYYNNTTDPDSIIKFGALYNWYAVDTKKLAPAGWHVPTDAEWDILQNYLIAHGFNWDGTRDSNKIAKSLAAQTDWEIIDFEGSIGNDLTKNNTSGFSALPSGRRGRQGGFDLIGHNCYWWSATMNDWESAYYRNLNIYFPYLDRFAEYDRAGFSIRLVKN